MFSIDDLLTEDSPIVSTRNAASTSSLPTVIASAPQLEDSTRSSVATARALPSSTIRSTPQSSPQSPHLSVFLEFVREDALFLLPHHPDETLKDFSMRLADAFGIPSHNQTVVLLGSPRVIAYNLAKDETFDVKLPPNTSVLIRNNSSNPNLSNAPAVNIWQPCFGVHSLNVLDQAQEQVRDELKAILMDRSLGINLQTLSALTGFSKAALSLWRRGLYRGKSALIAATVKRIIGQVKAQSGAATSSSPPSLAPSNALEADEEEEDDDGPNPKRSRVSEE